MQSSAPDVIALVMKSEEALIRVRINLEKGPPRSSPSTGFLVSFIISFMRRSNAHYILPNADYILPNADYILPDADRVPPNADYILPSGDHVPPPSRRPVALSRSHSGL